MNERSAFLDFLDGFCQSFVFLVIVGALTYAVGWLLWPLVDLVFQ